MTERARDRTWIVGWWALGRALVLATAAVMHVAGPHALIGSYVRGSPLGALAAWDGRWYDTVASSGYLLVPGRQSDPAFFPLFPLLLRGAHALGLGYFTAGVVIGNLSFLGALFAFEALTRHLFGSAFARRATTYVALFPVGFVFSMAYPESFVLGGISLTILAALRGRWGAAAVLGALGTLARPEALFVSLPLLELALREGGRRRGLALGAVAAPFAALASFALYLGLTVHDPLAWTHAQKEWGRHFSPIGPIHALARLPHTIAGNAWVVRDVVFLLIYLGLLLAARRAHVPRAWVAAGAVVVVLPAFSGQFHSIARFGLLAPALYWGLTALVRSRRADLALRAASALLLVGGTVSLAYIFP